MGEFRLLWKYYERKNERSERRKKGIKGFKDIKEEVEDWEVQEANIWKKKTCQEIIIINYYKTAKYKMMIMISNIIRNTFGKYNAAYTALM